MVSRTRGWLVMVPQGLPGCNNVWNLLEVGNYLTYYKTHDQKYQSTYSFFFVGGRANCLDLERIF